MKKESILTTLISVLAAIAVSLSACSDDFDVSGDGDRPKSGFVVRVPDTAAAGFLARTRGDNRDELDVTPDEGELHELWLLVFKADDGTLAFRTELTIDPAKTHKEYQEYEFDRNTLAAGDYRMYLLANLSAYASGSWKTDKNLKEDDIKGLPLYFRDSSGNYLLTASKAIDNGLPMACLSDEIVHNGNKLTGGTFTYNPSVDNDFVADLTFLCSKLRYTILFDKSEDGFSSQFNAFSFSLKGADMERIQDSSQVEGANANAGTFGLKGVSCRETEYPANPEDYPEMDYNGVDQRYVNLTPLKEEGSGDTRAWQGALYLPENTAGDTDARTLLKLAAHTEQRDLSYSLPLVPPFMGKETEGMQPLLRGHAYDVVARIKSISEFEVKLGVSEWTAKRIIHHLHGAYFLHVDKTEVEVQSGKTTAIWYDTDAETLEFDSPKVTVDGKEVDLYTFEVVGDSIHVGVNRMIPTEKFADINADKQSYSYFHINAGTLHKRIQVSPLNLVRYLNVAPRNVVVDVRERLASFEYSGSIDITVETNLKTISLDGDPFTDEIKKRVFLTDASGNPLSFGSPITVGADGLAIIRVNYRGINSSDKGDIDFWNMNNVFGFDVKGNEGDFTAKERVTVTTVPAIDDYVIHLHTHWEQPHIYVYQILDLPSDFTGVAADGTPLASKPVGYGSGGAYWAALEYSFTGKIAFKGWHDAVNSRMLQDGVYNYKGEVMFGPKYEGFFIFPGNHNLVDSKISDWNAVGRYRDERYETDNDFCAEQREQSYCSDCKTNAYNRLWPGMAMESEGDGWWKFTLTGVATPGKALIMFNDGHEESPRVVKGRYPGADKVGVPLFNFPSHEGWFDADSDTKMFYSYRPEVTNTFVSKTYRFYFKEDYLTHPDGRHYDTIDSVNIWGEDAAEDMPIGRHSYQGSSPSFKQYVFHTYTYIPEGHAPTDYTQCFYVEFTTVSTKFEFNFQAFTYGYYDTGWDLTAGSGRRWTGTGVLNKNDFKWNETVQAYVSEKYLYNLP